ncbi:helix-turn-helix domain-containing protein [Nocardia cyriacigeorgica]|uniref:helix-turn-helix domain-containing protein n=1 Tax=Nocardia cyriacigeorgica TaxID=135487 RepID=UPI002457369B|nr:helix-turn-helix domain-containing protein [Nocardia cyriacigeorgica]
MKLTTAPSERKDDRLVDKEKAKAYLGGISTVTLYELINAGEIQRINIGRRAFISYRSIQDYIQRLKDAQA